MPTRSTPLPRGKPMDRVKGLTPGGRLRRAVVVRVAEMSRTTPARKRKTAVGEFTPKVRRMLYARFGGRCAYCGDPLPPKWWTAQHRRARGMGGSKDPATCSPAAGVAVHELPCHRRIEDNPAESLLSGFRIPQGADPTIWPLRIWTGELVHLNHDGTYVPAHPEERP